MLLWRISSHPDLSGVGGLKAAARWHYAGRAIVYLAESPAAALLEACVHTSAGYVPPEYKLQKIEAPNVALTEMPSINPADLPDDWRSQPSVTRELGSAWLARNESPLLRVPSALVPETMNCLFNPLHRLAPDIRIVEVIAYPFDPRLKK